MEDWKKAFLDRLNSAQAEWAARFEKTLDAHILPAYDEVAKFLNENDFHVTMPLNEQGRRSFKFELAENAYLLLIFRSTAIGEFELRRESFVPGCEPILTRRMSRIADVDDNWSRNQFRAALDEFVEQLAGQSTPSQFEPAIV